MISVKDIIQQGWKIYEENFKTVIKITVWSFLAMCIGTLGIFLTSAYFTGHYALRSLIELAVNLPQILIALWVAIVLIDFFNKILWNKKAIISESINRGFKIYTTVLILSMIVAIIEIAGFIFLIIPGVIFTIWLTFGVYEVVLNNKNIKEAMKSSRELSRNRWFPVAWRYFAPGVFWAFAGWGATSILVFAMKQLLFLTNTTFDIAGTRILTLIVSTIQNAFYVFFMPLIIVSAVILYRNLKKI